MASVASWAAHSPHTESSNVTMVLWDIPIPRTSCAMICFSFAPVGALLARPTTLNHCPQNREVIRKRPRLQLRSQRGFAAYACAGSLKDGRGPCCGYGYGAIGIKDHEIARSNVGATYCDRLIDGSHVGLGRSPYTNPARPDGQAKRLQFLCIADRCIHQDAGDLAYQRLGREQLSD